MVSSAASRQCVLAVHLVQAELLETRGLGSRAVTVDFTARQTGVPALVYYPFILFFFNMVLYK